MSTIGSSFFKLQEINRQATLFETWCVCNMQTTGIEGRAGMAAIVDTANEVDLKKFNCSLQLRLPTYARPVFIRLLDKLDLTGEQLLIY